MSEKATPKDVIAAIKAGDDERVRSMLGGNRELLHLKTPLGSWLHIATEQGQSTIVKSLIELGLDVNVKGGPSDITPLNIAAYKGNIELCDYFIDQGSELDVSEPDRNPLFGAIHGGHKDIVNRLLKADIDTEVSYTGQTMSNMDAIDFAREWGREEIVELLKAHKGSRG